MQKFFPPSKTGSVTSLGRLHSPQVSVAPLIVDEKQADRRGRGALCSSWTLDYKQRPENVLVMIHIWTVPGHIGNDADKGEAIKNATSRRDFKVFVESIIAENNLEQVSDLVAMSRKDGLSSAEAFAELETRTIVLVKAQSGHKQIPRSVMLRVQEALKSIERPTKRHVPLKSIVLRPIRPAATLAGTTFLIVLEVSLITSIAAYADHVAPSQATTSSVDLAKECFAYSTSELKLYKLGTLLMLA